MRLLTTLILFLFLSGLQAQDPHFSQYSMATAYVNPALTGLTEAQHRLSFKYRNQWRSVLGAQAYQTVAAAYDFKVCDGRNFFGFGMSLLGDQVGEYPFYTVGGNLSIAYHQELQTGRYLVGGLQGGLIQYRIGDGALRFDTQFDGLGGHDPTLPTFEEIERMETNLLVDVNLGVAFYTLEGLVAGLALYHANQPNFSFKPVGNELSSRLNMRLVGHARLPLIRKDEYVLYLRQLVMIQRPITELHHWQYLPGLETRVFYGPKQDFGRGALHAGAGLRVTDDNLEQKTFVLDAVVLNARLDYQSLSLGVAYDVNLSPLNRVSTGRGGFELSLMWRFFSRNACVTCPTF